MTGDELKLIRERHADITRVPSPADVGLLLAHVEDLESRIHEQNVQFNDAAFPVYQACEKCGPAVLNEAGKCPTCQQVYDFSRWQKLTSEVARQAARIGELDDLVKRQAATILDAEAKADTAEADERSRCAKVCEWIATEIETGGWKGSAPGMFREAAIKIRLDV